LDYRQNFTAVFNVVRQIPKGSVMTYGEVGSEAGVTARVVGWAMANVDSDDIPWHRVVGKDGYLRIGRRSPELMALQRKLLESENVVFLENGTVDMDRHVKRD
jgi:methylated-DNA-protein-cysteine methyltransferase-like protein